MLFVCPRDEHAHSDPPPPSPPSLSPQAPHHVKMHEFLQCYLVQPWLAELAVQDVRCEEGLTLQAIEAGKVQEELSGLLLKLQDNANKVPAALSLYPLSLSALCSSFLSSFFSLFMPFHPECRSYPLLPPTHSKRTQKNKTEPRHKSNQHLKSNLDPPAPPAPPGRREPPHHPGERPGAGRAPGRGGGPKRGRRRGRRATGRRKQAAGGGVQEGVGERGGLGLGRGLGGGEARVGLGGGGKGDGGCCVVGVV